MPTNDPNRRQSGWRVLVAATAVTLTGGAAIVQATEATSGARVTLDDVVPLNEVSRPVAISLRGSTDGAVLWERELAAHHSAVEATNDDGTAAAGTPQTTADPTPNSPDPTSNTPNTPDPTPNTPDPTPNSPDPTPDTPDSPDPTPDSPDSPDPTPDSPDPTPNTPDASPDSPD